MAEYRIWWIPNPPRKAFMKPYPTLQQARDALDLLADYDMYLDDIEMDLIYANAGGIQKLQENGEWEEIEEDEEEG